jgi:isoquinoline 1-oxidoreductase alpha subunit
MLIMPDGQQVGSISGGCLERDVARNAWRWVEVGPQVVDFDTRADVFAPHGRYGTGCEGVVTVLLQKMPAEGLDVMEVLGQAQAAGEAVVVAHRYGGPRVGEQAVWRAGGVEASAGFGLVGEGVARAAARVLGSGRAEGLELGDEGAVFIEYVPLLWVLREELGLTGTKFGCGKALCGACTVHVDGASRRSCVTAAGDVAGREVLTIEGLGSAEALHVVQRAWMEDNVPQCGYCQAGQIMQAAALLAVNPAPSDDEIDAAMSANLCRCGTYPRIRQAVRRAATMLGAR